VRRTERKSPLGRPRCIWEDNIKMGLQEVSWDHGLDCSDSGLREVASFCECGSEPSCAIKCGALIGHHRACRFLKDLLFGV
jgi:hypothetical protein